MVQPSQASKALDELLAVQAQAIGGVKTVTMDGRRYQRLGGDAEFAEQVTDGAEGEGGRVTFAIRMADCPKRPKQLSVVVIDGLTLAVLSVVNINGNAWEITAGDPGNE